VSQIAQAYCFRCKAKREIKNAELVLLKNNRLGSEGVCPVCGGKVFRLVKGADPAESKLKLKY